MSADHLTPNGERAANGMKSWRFRMDNPIPPYLIALGVGDIAFASLVVGGNSSAPAVAVAGVESAA